nr:hypothetical protein TorRG33x02_180150 [Ipomoea trifida]
MCLQQMYNFKWEWSSELKQETNLEVDVDGSVEAVVAVSWQIFQAMESQHLRTICRFSAQGDRGSQDLRTVMVSFQDERATNVKKASALVMRFPSSCASFISRNSEAHLSAATLLGLRHIWRP